MCYLFFFVSESTHQREVEQNDARRERNFRIRRHLSVDDTEPATQNAEANQVCVVVKLPLQVRACINYKRNYSL